MLRLPVCLKQTAWSRRFSVLVKNLTYVIVPVTKFIKRWQNRDMWYYHVCLSLGWPSPAPNADLFFLAPGRCPELSGYTAILAACAPPFFSPGPHLQWALQSTCRAISFLRQFMSWAMVLGNLCSFFFFPPSPFGFISARSGKIQPRGPCTTFPETGNAGSAAQSIPMLLEAQLLNCFDAGTRIQEPVARSRVRE